MSQTESPSKENTDPPSDKASSNISPSKNVEEENSNLRKQLRALEGEHKTTKALLEQKIELLENQISGFQERETSLKQMNETIMLALNDMNNKDYNSCVSKATKELEIATEHHNKEMQEFRNRTNELIKNLENENRKLKEGASENEMRLKELTLHFEKAQLGFNQTINELEQEKAALETKLRKIDEERIQNKELNDYELLVKTNEFKMNNEREKEEHRKEIQKLKESYDKSIQEAKLNHENEKRTLDGKINKLQESISQEGSKKDTLALNELKAKHQKEVQGLKDVISQMDISRGKELDELRKQRDQANEKVEKLESQIKKLKTSLKSSQEVQEQNSKLLKDKLEKAKSVMDHGEALVAENEKYKQKIIEMKAAIKKLETSDQALKDLIKEKDNKMNEDRIEFKKMLQNEQKKQTQSAQEILSNHSSRNNLSRRQSAIGTNQLDESSSISSKRDVQSTRHSQPSPKEEIIPESKKTVSQRKERSISPVPVDLTSSKQSRSSAEEPVSQKRGVTNKIQDSIDLKRSAKEEIRGAATKKLNNSRTPLETSFADHDFGVDNDIEDTQKSVLKPGNGKSKQDKSFAKGADINTMPINYAEFVKRSQRTRRGEERQEDEVPTSRRDTSQEPKISTITDEVGPTLFFTTSQEDDNQPLFGTSHFVFEGNQRSTGNQLQSELSQIRRESLGDNLDQEFEKRIPGYVNELDMEDIVEIGGIGDISRISMSYNNRRASMKEDLETRPSLMNPMYSVFESTNMMDALHDPQASIDFLSAHPKSVMDRDREKEREREKIFSSSRCSVNTASVSRGNGNGSRQKIEGRLKDLEWKLKEMELKNQGLRVEKDKVQFEFEKLMVELNEKRAESEGMRRDSNEPWDEKKEEKEIALKNEIKFLINKLLKVKNKLEKQSEELNVTKNTNILGQSQMNFSMYQAQPRKDFSKDYSILGGLNNVSTSQIRERENWNPMNMVNNTTLQTSQNLRKSTVGDLFNGATHLNPHITKVDNYKVSERNSNKTTLGTAIENFAKNVRSRSNIRYDHNRESQNQNISLNYGMNKGNENIINSATTRTYRSKGPILPRPEDMGSQMGSIMNREVLRPINTQNYEGNNLSNSSIGYEGNSSYLYQRKSNR